MKKSFAFISLFLMLGVTTLFAEVSVKKLPDGNAEVRFFYGNPRAEEFLLQELSPTGKPLPRP